MRRILSYAAISLGILFGLFASLQLGQTQIPDFWNIRGWIVQAVLGLLAINHIGASITAIRNPRRAALWLLGSVPVPILGFLRDAHPTDGTLFAIIYGTVPLIAFGSFWWIVHKYN